MSDYTYQQLLQQHQHTTSIRERTRLETEMWAALDRDQRKQFGDQPAWGRATLGISKNDACNRMGLFNAGKDADPLWVRVENGSMKIGTAIRLFRQARALAIERNTKVPKMVAEVLKEYAKLPARADGVRANYGMSRTRRLAKKPGSSRAFWTDLRKRISEHVRAELPEGDLPDIESLWTQLETDIKISIETFQGRMQYNKAKGKAKKSVTRRELREAFEALLLEPPRRGKPIDIEAVRKNKRLLARQYHPDLNQGDDGMVEAYQSVIAAAALIEREYETQQDDA